MRMARPPGFAFGAERRCQVDEGGRHLAPVAELQGALAEAAAGDDGDGVGGAAVDLDEGDEALAVAARGRGVVDAEALAAQHSHADAEHLAGAEMAVGDLGFAEEVVEGLHRLMILLPANMVRASVSIDVRLCGGGNIRGPRCPMSELATTIGMVLKQKSGPIASIDT